MLHGVLYGVYFVNAAAYKVRTLQRVKNVCIITVVVIFADAVVNIRKLTYFLIVEL